MHSSGKGSRDIAGPLSDGGRVADIPHSHQHWCQQVVCVCMCLSTRLQRQSCWTTCGDSLVVLSFSRVMLRTGYAPSILVYFVQLWSLVSYAGSANSPLLFSELLCFWLAGSGAACAPEFLGVLLPLALDGCGPRCWACCYPCCWACCLPSK
eukprot:scpid36497/ scgid20721/ 